MKRLLTALLVLIGIPSFAADTAISGLPARSAPFDNSDVMPWAIPGVSNYKLTWQDMTNNTLAGMASQAYARSMTNGFPWTNVQVAEAAFAWYAAYSDVINETNHVTYATNAGTATVASSATNAQYAGIATNALSGWPTSWPGSAVTSAVANATTAAYVSGTLTNNTTGSATGAQYSTNTPYGGTLAGLSGTNTWTANNVFSAAMTNSASISVPQIWSVGDALNVSTRGNYLVFGWNGRANALYGNSQAFYVNNGMSFPVDLGVNGTFPSSGFAFRNIGAGNLYLSNSVYCSNVLSSYMTVTNSLVASNISLSVPRWIDAPGQIFGAPAGKTMIPTVDMLDGTYAYAFSRVNGGIAYGTENVPFTSEAPHTLWTTTNSTWMVTNLWVEAHVHGRPLIAPVAPNTNISFRIVWKDCKPGTAPSGTFTNVVTYGLTAGSTNEMLIEFNHHTYQTFFPDIATTWTANVTVTNAGSNNYIEQAGAGFVIRCPSFHVPVGGPNAIGSTTDSAP